MKPSTHLKTHYCLDFIIMQQNYKYLRLFPLNLVVYPGENLNLHIFEPRYQQLINECIANGETFGIPVCIDNKMMDYGAEVEILALVKLYENGEMDITTRGVAAFELSEVFEPSNNLLYSGASVATIKFDDTEEDSVRIKLEDYIRDFYSIVSPTTPLDFSLKTPLSNHFGHKIGLSFRQEYEMFLLTAEYERQNYMLNHLAQVIPVLNETERLKDRIKLNGHFRKLSAGGSS